jgi:ER-bound oxygenase mpaB/B'/Rubber oxygenase, catalytic domain
VATSIPLPAGLPLDSTSWEQTPPVVRQVVVHLLAVIQQQDLVSETPYTEKVQLAMREFVDQRSIVRTIWGSPDLILLIFAGSAAEFALNRAVDWLFFTGNLPRDPIGRLFSTVRYAQEIVFVTEETARRTLDRINAIHGAVERQRRQPIPDWAHRAVLYMLVDYSERAYSLLYRPLSASQQQDLYTAFRRIGDGLRILELPVTYAEWRRDRRRHLGRDLAYSRQTSLLFRRYRRHLGLWRYYLLLQVQALLVPDEVRRLLHLSPNPWLSRLVRRYGIVERCHLQSVVHSLLIPSRYWAEVRKFDRIVAA